MNILTEIHLQIFAVLFCIAVVSAAPKPGFPLVDTIHHVSSAHVASPVVSSYVSPAVSSVVAPAIGSVVSPVVRSYGHFDAPVAYSGYPYGSYGSYGAYSYGDYPGFGYSGFGY